MIGLNVFYNLQLIKAADNEGDLRNLPMYNNVIKVYRNTNIKLALFVRRLDRKVLKITNDKLYFLNVLSQDGQYNLIRKQFNPDDISTGRFSIELERIDIDILKIGRYNYSITFVDSSSNEYPLFLDQNAGAVGEFHVLENVLPAQLPPYIQFDFTKIRTISGIDYPNAVNIDSTFISSRLPIRNELHRLVLKFDNFTGKIKIQKTRNIDPNDQESWEDISEYDYISNSIEEEIQISNIDATFIRVQFEYYKSNEGKVIEIQYF